MQALRTSARWARRALASATLLTLTAGCGSTAIDAQGMGGTGSSSAGGDPTDMKGGTAGAASVTMSACSGALRQTLGLVSEQSEGEVAVLEGDAASEMVLYVDASAGGVGGRDGYPWVYVSLASGTSVPLTDLEALTSNAWDLAFKRFVVRTNGRDSGPGAGGALRVSLPWASVDASTLGSRALPTEDWFDDDCNLTVDPNGELVTTFTGWSMYNEATHTLSAGPFVFLVRGAQGALYKVAILDYYSSPSGKQGSLAGRYKLRVAPLN